MLKSSSWSSAISTGVEKVLEAFLQSPGKEFDVFHVTSGIRVLETYESVLNSSIHSL